MTTVAAPNGVPLDVDLIVAVDAAVRVLSPDYAALNSPTRETLHRQAEAMLSAALPSIVAQVCGALHVEGRAS